MNNRIPVLVLFILAFALSGASCARKSDRKDDKAKPAVVPGAQGQGADTHQPNSAENSCGDKPELPTAQITILGTNDIHGGVEPAEIGESGALRGGLPFYAGVVSSIKQGVKCKLGDKNGGVLVVDGGDQFQGTLLSNFDEGKLLFSSMSEIGYDAAVPGNHDYDFGPTGWTIDQTPGTDEASLRGALRETLKSANFPLISANTYFKSSIKDQEGKLIAVEGRNCKPIVAEGAPVPEIDWSKAETLDFLKPYIIKEVAGVKVALIGIDNPGTPTSTTPHNVSDLCFDDEADAYLRVRKELEGKADVFVLVIHNGNINRDVYASTLVEKLTSAPAPARGSTIDAVIAGHTHTANNAEVRGVPIIQSGANGQLFGRVDLVYDRASGKVDQSKTKRNAGIQLLHAGCSGEAGDMCTANAGKVAYEGVEVVQSKKVLDLVASRRKEIEPISGRKMGTADKTIDRSGGGESAMGNLLTDLLRFTSEADVSFMNNGGIRTTFNPRNLPNTVIVYEDLFRVLPFSNRGVVLGPMKIDGIYSILIRNAKACGGDGMMSWSGLKVSAQRKCVRRPDGSSPNDDEAILTRVETVGGELLIENNRILNPERTFKVATLDFLQAGGSGYTQFSSVPLLKDLGIVRDVMANYLAEKTPLFSPEIDGRFKVTERQTPAPAPDPAQAH